MRAGRCGEALTTDASGPPSGPRLTRTVFATVALLIVLASGRAHSPALPAHPQPFLVHGQRLVPGLPPVRGEEASAAGSLERERLNARRTVGERGVRVELHIGQPIYRFESSNATSRVSADPSKISAGDDVPIGLDNDRQNTVVGIWIERIVRRSGGGIKTRHVCVRGASYRRESATGENLLITL